jgi:hypothetical protein
MAPATFFTQLVERLGSWRGAGKTPTQRRARGDHVCVDYANNWHQMETQGASGAGRLLATEPFGEFAAVAQVLAALPAGAHLQIGNSMAIRYANFAGCTRRTCPAAVDSNRGASGIDGTVSTAVGAAWPTRRPHPADGRRPGLLLRPQRAVAARTCRPTCASCCSTTTAAASSTSSRGRIGWRMPCAPFFLTPQPLTARAPPPTLACATGRLTRQRRWLLRCLTSLTPGQPTRGKTTQNRLRRVDLFLAWYAPGLLRRT